ncbi:MAG: cysteine desulfurase [Pseudomonadota bacterium]|nr:cysteine desulfurase [Pseudomonadota bacterium]
MATTTDAIAKVRQEFPFLRRKVHGGLPLTYFDNAAMTPVPSIVQQRLASYYQSDTANIHRGLYYVSVEATRQYEDARKRVQKFINAKHCDEIIFMPGTTIALNLLAQAISAQFAATSNNDSEKTEIILTTMEHHSNIVPWQLQTNLCIKYLPMLANGELDLDALPQLISSKTKLISLVHASNSIGTINPLPEILQLCKAHGLITIVDAAQSVGHMPVDVQTLDCDYLVFSSHKIYAPTGVGVLYGKQDMLKQLPVVSGGGGSIKQVDLDKTSFLPPPAKFEAGTPNISGVLGLDSALEFLMNNDLPQLWQHEQDLLSYATAALQEIDGVRIIGTARQKVSILSFVIAGIHPHDIGTLLDFEGIAVRASHHCTHPTMKHFKVPATVRAAFSFFNTTAEVDLLVKAVSKAIHTFR